MIILTETLPIWLVLVFMYLFTTPTVSQSDFIYNICGTAANYTRNSTFEKNLATALSVLSNTNSGFGFFNYTTGQGIDTVNSIALCRGDVNLDVCQRCLNDSIVNLKQGCPNQKEAAVYYDHCLLRYSNHTILGKYQDQQKPYLSMWNMQNFSDKDRFNVAPGQLLNGLKAKAAAGDSLLKFDTGNITGSNLTTYGLVQCTPDLQSQQCSDCLEDVLDKFSTEYGTPNGGRVLLPMCNFRYEIYPFYNESTPAIPPPPTSSSPPNTQVLSSSPGMKGIILLGLCG